MDEWAWLRVNKNRQRLFSSGFRVRNFVLKFSGSLKVMCLRQYCICFFLRGSERKEGRGENGKVQKRSEGKGQLNVDGRFQKRKKRLLGYQEFRVDVFFELEVFVSGICVIFLFDCELFVGLGFQVICCFCFSVRLFMLVQGFFFRVLIYWFVSRGVSSRVGVRSFLTVGIQQSVNIFSFGFQSLQDGY